MTEHLHFEHFIAQVAADFLILISLFSNNNEQTEEIKLNPFTF